MKFQFLLNKVYHEWTEKSITETQLKKIGNIGLDEQLFLNVQDEGEQITNKKPC